MIEITAEVIDNVLWAGKYHDFSDVIGSRLAADLQQVGLYAVSLKFFPLLHEFSRISFNMETMNFLEFLLTII